MAHHHGMRKKNRDKLSKTVRTRGISPVVKAIQEFEPGSRVHILIDPSRHKGMPHPKFHGKTGVIVAKRGRAFVLSVTDGNSAKTVIALPEHLTGQKNSGSMNYELLQKYRRTLASVDKKERVKYIGNLLNSLADDMCQSKT